MREKGLRNANVNECSRGRCLLHVPGTFSTSQVGSWKLVVGGWGGWRLAVGGGWQLAVILCWTGTTKATV